MDNNHKENLKKLAEELLLEMDFEAKIEIDASQSEFLVVNIQSEEAGLLIGQGGENLSALQHILRIIVSKRLGQEPINFIVDVNNYKGHRLALLKEMALSLHSWHLGARYPGTAGQSPMQVPTRRAAATHG